MRSAGVRCNEDASSPERDSDRPHRHTGRSHRRSPEGKQRLHARMFEAGYSKEVTLRIPRLYGMIFRLKCSEGCWTKEPPYLFLIDIGLGDDAYGWKPGDPFRWEKP
jgi:hypothetical protein